MYRIWQWYEPKTIFVGLYLFLAILAFTIHFILLSTDRYNWLEQRAPRKAASAIEFVSPVHLPV